MNPRSETGKDAEDPAIVALAAPDCDHVVVLVDDDPSILRALERLLVSRGYTVRAFPGPAELLEWGEPQVPACLVLDHLLGGGETGLELHATLRGLGWTAPTVFLTAHWDVPSVVQAMRDGADGFLTKPCEPGDILAAVARAMTCALERHAARLESADLSARAALLTEREKEVVRLVVGGALNKEAAEQLGLALVTIKVHRGNAMRKLGARTAAELARLAGEAGIVG